MAKVALICFVMDIIGYFAGFIGLGFIRYIPLMWSVIIMVRIWRFNEKARKKEEEENED